MESPEENPSWVFDLALIEDIPVSAGDFSCLEPGFRWPGNTISVPTRSFRFLSLTFPSNHYYRLLVENNCLHFFFLKKKILLPSDAEMPRVSVYLIFLILYHLFGVLV